MAMVAPIGCSVSVETNSPIAPRAAKHSAEVDADREQHPATPRSEGDLGAGEQGHVAAAEDEPARRPRRRPPPAASRRARRRRSPRTSPPAAGSGRPARPAGSAACRGSPRRRPSRPRWCRDRERQEQRQLDAERGERHEQAVAGDRGEEVRAAAASRGCDILTATAMIDRHDGEHGQADPVAPPAEDQPQLGPRNRSAQPRTGRPSCCRRRRAEVGAPGAGTAGATSAADIEALPGQRDEQVLQAGRAAPRSRAPARRR